MIGDDYILLAGKKGVAVFFISKHYSSTCLEGLMQMWVNIATASAKTSVRCCLNSREC
jgi:hypothetical protein